MAHVVRPYRDDDAEALAGILAAAITRIGPAAYSAEQVAAWSARPPGAAQYRQRAGAGDVIFVAADPADLPVAPEDVAKTVYHAMGIDDLTATDRSGRAFQLLDEGRVLSELF